MDATNPAEVPAEVRARLGQLFAPDVWAAWLCGHNSHLSGARPIDLLRHGRTVDVVEALNLEMEGGLS